MTRPTKDEVEAALSSNGRADCNECSPGYPCDACVLADELRALREECDHLAEKLVDERRKLSEVRAHLAKWQCKVAYPELTRCEACAQCSGVLPSVAADLRATLKGEP